MFSDEIKNVQIEEETIKKLMKIIINIERDNINTKQRSNNDMISYIKSIIEGELNEN